MKIDHTREVEKRVEAIPITVADGCAFYTPKEGSLIAVSLCAYCKYGEFKEKERYGFCKFHFIGKGENQR